MCLAKEQWGDVTYLFMGGDTKSRERKEARKGRILGP